MKILAFDTSSSGVSIALNQGELNLAQISTKDNKQSEILISKFEEILNQNNIWYQNLDAIAAISGPGSFTGVRVGLSTARTLKLSTKLPLILLSSLEVLAYKYVQKYQGEIFVAIDAKMDEFFVGHFYCNNGKIKTLKESKLATAENIAEFLPQQKFLLCGNAKKMVAEIIKEKNFECNFAEEDTIEAKLIANLAYQKIKSNEISDNLDAIYLRDAKITARSVKKKNGGRGRNRTDA